jgi:hypothetical protein
MRLRQARWWMALTILAASLTAISLVRPRARTSDELDVLDARVSQLRFQARFADAFPLAERLVTLARQMYGEEHVDYAVAIRQLASLYEETGRYAEAEPLVKGVLAIYGSIPMSPDRVRLSMCDHISCSVGMLA